MGVELQAVVDYVNANTKGLAAVDLARLNLRTGLPLSRFAMTLEDKPESVSRAWAVAKELIGAGSAPAPSTGARR